MDNQTKHWTEFLEDVGRPVLRQGGRQLDILGKISRLEREITALKYEYADNEETIKGIVSADWTEDEINEAKLKAKCLIKTPQ